MRAKIGVQPSPSQVVWLCIVRVAGGQRCYLYAAYFMALPVFLVGLERPLWAT